MYLNATCIKEHIGRYLPAVFLVLISRGGVFLEDISCNRKRDIVLGTWRMRWVGHVAPMGEGRGVHRVLVGKPEGKRSLGRPRCRWEDNIKMDLEGVVGTGWSWLRIGTGGGRVWIR